MAKPLKLTKQQIETAVLEATSGPGVSAGELHQEYVYPRYTIMLHVAWTHVDTDQNSVMLWQWGRERLLYNLVTSLNGSRFMVDGNESRILVDKLTNFTEQVVSLEFFDKSVKLKPQEFINKDPFSFLAEYSIVVPPKPNPRAVVAEVKQELAEHAEKVKPKPTAKAAKPAAKPVKKPAKRK